MIPFEGYYIIEEGVVDKIAEYFGIDPVELARVGKKAGLTVLVVLTLVGLYNINKLSSKEQEMAAHAKGEPTVMELLRGFSERNNIPSPSTSSTPDVQPPPPVSNPATVAPDTGEIQIDRDVIARFEGRASRRFYVPRNNAGEALGNSGVTVATGFDVGQHSAAELRTLFARHPAILTRLLPFANASKQAAINLLADSNINSSPLSEEDVITIDDIVYESKTDRLIHRYDRDSEAGFTSLPAGFQTVIASVSFQYGNLRSETPAFWRQVTTGEWEEALENLRNFGDDYSTRRNAEADIWEQSMPREESDR